VKLERVEWGAEKWSAALAPSPDLSLLQTWEYGEAKAQTGPWSAERAVLLSDGRELAAAQVLVRKAPLGRGGLAWLSRGPVVLGETDDGSRLEMLQALREHWVAERGLYMRAAPTASFGDIPNASMVRAGLRETQTPGWVSTRLDLRPSLPDLRSGFKQKWRNALNKAERLGVEVGGGTDAQPFERFVAAYDGEEPALGYRRTVTGHLLRALQDLLPPERKLITLEAILGDRPVSWMVLARYGTTGEYLASVNTADGRSSNAGQRLMWEAVCTLKSEGVLSLDLGGGDPADRSSGISQFKAGVGGETYRLPAELEATGGGWGARIVRRAVMRAER
jgi:lipid II:glycine glycyltransferase (peptidoglycan interpeptide bridge formation enzyme)